MCHYPYTCKVEIMSRILIIVTRIYSYLLGTVEDSRFRMAILVHSRLMSYEKFVWT